MTEEPDEGRARRGGDRRRRPHEENVPRSSSTPCSAALRRPLHQGEKVGLRGFGSFRFRRREPHRGRNPKTGDRVNVPSKRLARFKPGKGLKELINREPTQAIPPASSDTGQRRTAVPSAGCGGRAWLASNTGQDSRGVPSRRQAIAAPVATQGRCWAFSTKPCDSKELSTVKREHYKRLYFGQTGAFGTDSFGQTGVRTSSTDQVVRTSKYVQAGGLFIVELLKG